MKKTNLLGIALIGLLSIACGSKTTASAEAEAQNKTLVAYFSATGNTKEAAQSLQTAIGADILEIVPETPYTEADLDFRNRECRSITEIADSTARPALKEVADLAQYDTIFIGYPIWGNVAPRIINTFIEQSKLDGKKIYTFCTCGGGSGDNSSAVLNHTYPQLNFGDCKILKSRAITNVDSLVNAWLGELNLNK